MKLCGTRQQSWIQQGRRPLQIKPARVRVLRWIGALRQALPGRLNAPDLRRLILAYCHAQPHHGGSGAVYILLKRERGRGGGREGG